MSEIRQARESDHGALVRCVQQWWGDSRPPEQARELSMLLPKLFLQHFARTSFVIEGDATDGGADRGVRAFLVGFHSGDRRDESYIHFLGVDPAHRRQGIAEELYERFFAMARAAGRKRVRAVTSPENKGSIAFHRALGFELEKGDDEIDGVPFLRDYDGSGQPRVRFVRELGRAPEDGAPAPYSVTIGVRGYETDSQGHLNTSVYMQYAEHARWSLVQAAGIRQSELIEKAVGPVNLETAVRFHRELRAGDEVEVSCAFLWGEGPTFRVEQVFRCGGELVAEVASVGGMMDLAERRLLREPREAFRAFASDPGVLGI